MNKKMVLIGALALLLGFVAYKGFEAYLDIKDLDSGLDDEIFGM